MRDGVFSDIDPGLVGLIGIAAFAAMFLTMIPLASSKMRGRTVFNSQGLDTVIGIQLRGWVFDLCMTELYAGSSILQDMFSVLPFFLLFAITLVMFTITYYYRRRPRSLNRLLFLSEIGTFCMILTVVITVSSFLFSDRHILDSISRVGWIFIIPVPVALGLVSGFAYGWHRWAGVGQATFSDDLSEDATYRLFFANAQTSKSPAYWGAIIMILILLPLAALKPFLGHGGTLMISATLLWFSIGMASISIGIRRHFFIRQSGLRPLNIIGSYG